MDVTVGWCSEFEPSWRVRRLFYASRPPALFHYHLGCALTGSGHALAGRAILDEDLGLGGLSPGASAAVASCDIAYVSSHGRMDGNSTYHLRLRRGEWAPTSTAHSGGPCVLVLDTCDVVKAGVDPKSSAWLRHGQPTPSIVLGFVGAATDGYSASLRGRAFAQHLAAGETFAESWFNAIRDTQPARRRDRAIAIAFGTTEALACATLDSASLTSLPARTVADACSWRQR